MSDIVNTATIKVVVDGDGVDAGLRKVNDAVVGVESGLKRVDDAATKTGRTLDSLGQGPGIKSVGDGADAAATGVDRATARMAEAIKRATQATTALSAGAKGTAENFAALADSRGLNKDVLKPFLASLDDAARKTDLVAQAQRRLDESTKFLDSLKSRTDGIGKSAAELAALRAAQLGVADAAGPMIAKLREAEKAGESSFGTLSEMAGKFKGVLLAVTAGIATAAAAGAALIGSAIKDLGDLDDLAQKTGSSVENLSKIQKIVTVFGPDMESVSGALNKLAKGMATVDDESNKTHKALTAIGVASKDASGKLRDPAEVLVDLAKKLQGYNDGAAKTALITDAVGKSGADLLPFLNDLAENYEKVTGVSAEAASAAAGFQDQLGWAKLRLKEVSTSIAIDALPALTDLAGAFLDVAKRQGDLTDGNTGKWADELAIGIAGAVDFARTLVNTFVALAGSIKVIWTDLKTLAIVAANANPTVAGYKWLTGGSALNDIKAALAAREDVLKDANARYEKLLNQPADEFEQAVRKRIAARVKDAVAPAAAAPAQNQKDLRYQSGNNGAAAAAEAEAKRIADAAKEQAKLLGELSGLSPTFTKDWDSLSAAYAKGTLNIKDLTAAQAVLLAKQPAIKAANDAQAKAAEDEKKLYEDSRAAVERDIGAIMSQVEAQELKVKTYGMLPDAITAAQVAELEASKQSKVLTDEGLADIQRRIDGLTRLGSAQTASQIQEDAKKASADLDKFLDPTKAQTFGEALRTAFGSAGDSLTKLAGSLQQYGIKQAEIAKARKDADAEYEGSKKGGNDYAKYLERIGEISKKNTKEQLGSYGDMASAASGFFDEHSRGYQALQTASQVFHAAELAMTLAELVPKGISAVLSQGQGDPYSAFGRMAAMAAIVAGLGVAIGGVSGGADTTAKDRQAANGTGSVLGDTNAKSDSLKKSLDLIEKNTYQDLSISASMLSVLQSINVGINGLGNILYRTDGFSTKALGVQAGGASAAGQQLGAITPILSAVGSKLTGQIANFLFGGNVHTVDTGISVAPGSLGQIAAGGANVSQYSDTKTDRGLFRKSKSGTQLNALGDEVDDQFTKILSGMGDAISQEAGILGLSGDAFTSTLNSFVVDIGKISTKDLKPEEVQAALQTALSKVGDDMAKFAVAGLQEFQNAGEGAFETLTRIATEYQTVDVVFESFGKTFGAVGFASVAARDELVQLAGGLDKFTAAGDYFLKNFFSDQEQAAALKKRIDPTLAKYGLSSEGDDAAKMFRDFVVALDTTTESGAQAYTALMTIAPALKQVTDAAKDAEETQKSLLGIQAEIYQFTGDKAAAAAVLEKQHAIALEELEPSLRAATKNLWSLQAAAEAIDKVKSDGSGLLNTVDNAYSVLQGIVGREKDVLQKRIDKEEDAVKRLQGFSETISSTLDSFKVPGAEKDMRLSAQAEIKSALASVQGGAQLSDAQIKSLGKAFNTVTQDSSKQFGSRESYLFDLLTTKNDIAALGKATDGQLSTQEQQLDLDKKQLDRFDAILDNAKDQVDQLKGISTIGLDIQKAIEGLGTAMLAARGNASVAGVAAISDAYKTSLGRAPDAAGLDYYQNLAAGGTSIGDIKDSIANSREAQIQGLYKDLLKRPTADSAGLDYYMKSGESIAQIAADIKKSDEYKKLHPFAVGTNYVPQTMPALVHEGERIIPAADNRALMARLSSPSDNSAALADAVKVLAATVTTLKEANEEMAKDMATMADALKNASTGGPLRVKVVN
jgi:hypothetical protein